MSGLKRRKKGETERKEGGSRKPDSQEGKQPHSTTVVSEMVPKILPLNPLTLSHPLTGKSPVLLQQFLNKRKSIFIRK